MKTKYSNSPLQDDRSDLFATLRGLDPRLCFTIGLAACAVIAFYIPSILIALTGAWVNSLIMLMPLLFFVTVLMVQNLIGNWLNRLLLVGMVFALVSDCSLAVFLARTSILSDWRHWWMAFFLPSAACPLNAWLFMRFKEATQK